MSGGSGGRIFSLPHILSVTPSVTPVFRCEAALSEAIPILNSAIPHACRFLTPHVTSPHCLQVRSCPLRSHPHPQQRHRGPGHHQARRHQAGAGAGIRGGDGRFSGNVLPGLKLVTPTRLSILDAWLHPAALPPCPSELQEPPRHHQGGHGGGLCAARCQGCASEGP